MNPYTAYRKQQHDLLGTSRIDVLLALYDGAIDRITQAIGFVQAKQMDQAFPLLAKSQLIVSELAAGVRVEINPDMCTNILRLYEFVVHQISLAQPKNLQDALKILKTLREGFESIREEALRMERSGEIAQADSLRTLSATA